MKNNSGQKAKPRRVASGPREQGSDREPGDCSRHQGRHQQEGGRQTVRPEPDPERRLPAADRVFHRAVGEDLKRHHHGDKQPGARSRHRQQRPAAADEGHEPGE
jgi:hypothetical protein